MAGDVEKLLNAVPIESYVQKYVSLKKKGRNYWGLCPFHNENTPSFSISPEKGIYKCFGCGKGGNLLSFIQQYEKLSFVDALKSLSEYSGIKLDSKYEKKESHKSEKEILLHANEKVKILYKNCIQNEIPASYLRKRGISKETADFFHLGYSPADMRFLESRISSIADSTHDQKSVYEAMISTGLLARSERNEELYNRFKGRLIFPIHNMKSDCIGFGGRILAKESTAAKYINSPDSLVFHKQNNLYNINHAKDFIRKNEQAILVEGYFDVIGLHDKDIKNSVAPLGTAFTENQARLLKRYTENLIIFFDSDKAGIEAAYRAFLTGIMVRLNCRVVIIESSAKEDPFDIAKKSDQIELLSLLDSAKDEISFILWYFFGYKYNISIFNEKKEAIQSFFEFLDNLSENWQKEEYLKNASKALLTDFESLKKDFMLFQKKGFKTTEKISEQKIVKAEKNTRISTIEKEILVLLLKFPELWDKTGIIAEINWVNENIFLLFSFFRDRIKTGEIWTFENINQAVSILPEDLSSLLSGIIIELEPAIEDIVKAKDEHNHDFIAKTLEKLMLAHKETTISKSIKDLKEKLSFEEMTGSPKTDEIANELGFLLEEKKKIAALLQRN